MRLLPISRHIALLCALVFISACSNLSKTPQPTGLGSEKDWLIHQQHTRTLEDWQISGKIAIRTTEQSGSATLNWTQQQQHFDIHVSGPLGQGSMRLVGQPNHIQLTTSKQQISSSSPELLMQQQLGWSVPLEHLLWWVRGLPAPQQQHQIQLNDDSTAYQIEQAGWQIKLLSYQNSQAGYRVPQRLKAYGPGLELTLFIKQWQN